MHQASRQAISHPVNSRRKEIPGAIMARLVMTALHEAKAALLVAVRRAMSVRASHRERGLEPAQNGIPDRAIVLARDNIHRGSRIQATATLQMKPA